MNAETTFHVVNTWLQFESKESSSPKWRKLVICREMHLNCWLNGRNKA